MSYDDVEAELRMHPEVRACLVTRIQTGKRKHAVVAYVVTTPAGDPARIREFLSAPRLRSSRIPEAVIPVETLPRTRSGAVNHKALPLPVVPGKPAGGKGSMLDMGDGSTFGVMLFLTAVFGAMSFVFTKLIWPGSTDLSLVPQPWAGWFTGLYVAESVSFGAGISFLFLGYGRMARMGRPTWLTVLAYLSVVWLLVAWWPQDNFYRLTAKTDWPNQAVLVYAFNVSMIIAAIVVVAFAVRERRED